MKRVLVLAVALLLTVGLGSWSAVQAQTHQVTFILNTATIPDTIPVSGAQLQLRGGLVHSLNPDPITWGNDSVNNMTSIGGDYYSKTLTLNTNDTIAFKFVIAYYGGVNTGWEQNVNSPYPELQNTNRDYIVADQDTTLDVQFWNNGSGSNPQYWRPWTPTAADTMSVYFRVSMAGPISSGSFSFNNNTDTVAVRGGGSRASYGDLNWAPSFYLTRESPATNGDGYTVAANSFWSGRVRIPKDSVNEGDVLQYKFLIGFDWGRDELQSQSNRTFKIPTGKKDTTLQWVFYNNERPSARVNTDTCIVTYVCDVSKALTTHGFTFGDTLDLVSGYFGTTTTPNKQITMQNLISSIYEGTDTIVTTIGSYFDYQYYAVKNSALIRENYYNFAYSGPTQSEAEKRQFIVPSKEFTIYDTAASITQARREPVFPNSSPLARKVLVTWECDLRPAIYQVAKGDTINAIQGGLSVYPSDKDSILKWGVWINGPAEDQWQTWGVDLANFDPCKMYDDGTHGDRIAGDSIFTRQDTYSPDSVSSGSKWQVGQTFKFGIGGSDNEGGSGGFGNNHSENIVDADSTYRIFNQFGSINPLFYSAWNYDLDAPTAVKDQKTLPRVFALWQNYPNPFNPSTKINYDVPKTSTVKLEVFNILGQLVGTLVNDRKEPGTYSVRFDGGRYPSGVYFYRMTAGNFVSTKKMAFIK